MAQSCPPSTPPVLRQQRSLYSSHKADFASVCCRIAGREARAESYMPVDPKVLPEQVGSHRGWWEARRGSNWTEQGAEKEENRPRGGRFSGSACYPTPLPMPDLPSWSNANFWQWHHWHKSELTQNGYCCLPWEKVTNIPLPQADIQQLKNLMWLLLLHHNRAAQGFTWNWAS